MQSGFRPPTFAALSKITGLKDPILTKKITYLYNNGQKIRIKFLSEVARKSEVGSVKKLQNFKKNIQNFSAQE
jgi:hypothetical protein